MKPFVIKNEEQYEQALAYVEKLMDAEPGSEEEAELEVWGPLVELYEEMMERSTSAEVKDIFNSLLLQEMKEKQTLVRNALGLMDI